jgi:hypothetical protein
MTTRMTMAAIAAASLVAACAAAACPILQQGENDGRRVAALVPHAERSGRSALPHNSHHRSPIGCTVFDSCEAHAGAMPQLAVTARDTVFDPPSYGGSDYVGPEHSSMPSPCRASYNWARATCWGAYESSRLQRDIDYIVANRLGKFHRLWISLDQLFSCFDATTGYCGYDATALANVDAALHMFAASGMQVDIVLLANGNENGFHFEALDDAHPAMRANYLTAVREFLTHIASDGTDVSAVAVVDLMNEAYYQSEVRGIDDQTVHRWLIDLYNTAHAAAPHLLYTVSDTGRLYRDQATWLSMYPVDVYDIHSYDDDPAANASVYANAAKLPKPWFAGEAGCGSGNVSCTYGSGIAVRTVDQWWLDNLRAYGARAVLIEDKGTLFVRRDHAYELQPVGQIVQAESSRAGELTNDASAPLPECSRCTVQQ